MEPHNVDIIVFSELVREQMQSNTPPLIRHRRPFFRGYPDVFVGCEAVAWAMKTLKSSDKDSDETNMEGDETLHTQKHLTEEQVLNLYRKLMDAGLLHNVTSQEEFRNDKSLYRFSSDVIEAEIFVRSVAIGYRLFKSALCKNCNLFQKVCALGKLVSCECLKASDVVSWLIEKGLCSSRELALSLAKSMYECGVLKPVDSDVQEFTDSRTFYMFAVDYRRTPVSVAQFLNSKIVCNSSCSTKQESEPLLSRNRLIHLRQTSDQLLDLGHLSLYRIDDRRYRKKDASTSSDESSSIDSVTTSSASYKSLLKSDGGMTKEALMHPSAPYVKKNLWIYPDPVGYGFVVRGDGPCFVKIVDPDSPAGKAGLKAQQYVVSVNGTNVMELSHTNLEDLILSGPKYLKLTVMQRAKSSDEKAVPSKPLTPSELRSPLRQRSPPLPSAQPWIEARGSSTYNVAGGRSLHKVMS